MLGDACKQRAQMPPFDIPMSRIREKQREQTEVFV